MAPHCRRVREAGGYGVEYSYTIFSDSRTGRRWIYATTPRGPDHLRLTIAERPWTRLGVVGKTRRGEDVVSYFTRTEHRKTT